MCISLLLCAFRQVSKENYFGTETEHLSVVSFVKHQGSGSKNIIELLVEFINQVSQKESLTWPNGMVPIYIEVYECMRYVSTFMALYNSFYYYLK